MSSRKAGFLPLLIGLAAAGHGPIQGIDLKIEGPSRIGRYEKIEFVLSGGGPWTNPFDPSEVEATLEIRTPSGKNVLLPAFWHQPYERQSGVGGRREEWLYPSGPAHFRARYAPSETGPHTARARRRDRRGTAESLPVSFEATASPQRGYVRVSAKDPRFFELDDGTPFFPLGHNTAFLGGNQFLTLPKVEEVFRKMAEHGANYARLWACCEDWALAIEARKSAWGRSWSWKPPFVPLPTGGTAIRVTTSPLPVNPSHPVAVRPETRYTLSGLVKSEGEAALLIDLGGPLGEPARGRDWTAFAHSFTTKPGQKWLGPLSLRATGQGEVLLRGLSLKEAAGGPELLWEADPDRPRRGVFNLPDAAQLDVVVQAAERHGLRLQFCFITRDLYMKDLEKADAPAYRQAVEDAKRLIRYVVARWGYSPSVASWEYFNEMNPGLPTEAAYREWARYLDEIDPYRHLRSTSAWGPAPKDYALPELSFADLHWYLRPAWGPLWKDAAGAALDRARYLLSQTSGKPAILGEFGLADDKWGLSPHMKADTELVHFHNALWASAHSGLAGAALFWWWDTLDPMNAYVHYRPLADYLAGIPFTTAGLVPFTAEGDSRRSRVAGLRGKQSAFLWIQDPRSTWWNRVVEKMPVESVEGETVLLTGLEPGSYRIEWWDTYGGKVLKKETLPAPAGGPMRLSVPAFSRDTACRITR